MSYNNFCNVTNQFRFCGNPFRIDTYSGCSFGCSYCFANHSEAKGHTFKFDAVNPDDLDKFFYTALETDKSQDKLAYECLRHRVPLHCGGLADPFQYKEREYRVTHHLIELSNKYNYPISFSTKTAHLGDDYIDILNPKIHTFQSSILGLDEDFSLQFEKNTPPPYERIKFVKQMRELGFWHSVRIQPLINIEQAKSLVAELGSIPSYITIEHLKIPQTNLTFFNDYGKYLSNLEHYKQTTVYYELNKHIKVQNIKAIQKIANANGVLIGCGDNDCHELSQSHCCCGVDLMGDEFSNWLKYNSTYILTGGNSDEVGFIPKCNCKMCLFSHSLKKFDNKRFISYKEIVDKYLTDHTSVFSVKKKLF